jgi:iduronate 2-sulfatase/deleted-in-malignant-brain-tumors protein 1
MRRYSVSLVLLVSSISQVLAATKKKRDIVMIAIDDMRPELGAYGCDHMSTPGLDALAKESLVFDNAYVAVAWCSPSRTAFLTSRRPDSTMTWSVVPSEYWRERGGNFTTLPQYFKESGYLTIGMGKIFHPGPASGNCDVKYSWSPESLPWDDNGHKCPTGGSFFKSVSDAECH